MKTKTKENPKTKESLKLINESLQKKKYLTIIAKCKLKNDEKSTKDRIIMIKPDGTLIVD